MIPDDTAVIAHVLGGGRLPQPTKDECPSQTLWEVVETCWMVPKKFRPTFAQLCVQLGEVDATTGTAAAAAASTLPSPPGLSLPPTTDLTRVRTSSNSSSSSSSSSSVSSRSKSSNGITGNSSESSSSSNVAARTPPSPAHATLLPPPGFSASVVPAEYMPPLGGDGLGGDGWLHDLHDTHGIIGNSISALPSLDTQLTAAGAAEFVPALPAGTPAQSAAIDWSGSQDDLWQTALGSNSETEWQRALEQLVDEIYDGDGDGDGDGTGRDAQLTATDSFAAAAAPSVASVSAVGSSVATPTASPGTPAKAVGTASVASKPSWSSLASSPAAPRNTAKTAPAPTPAPAPAAPPQSSSPPSAGSAAEAPLADADLHEEPTRIDPTDGQRYTQDAFYDCYNGLAEWNAAGDDWTCKVQTCMHTNDCNHKHCNACGLHRPLKTVKAAKKKTGGGGGGKATHSNAGNAAAVAAAAAASTSSTKKKKKKKKEAVEIEIGTTTKELKAVIKEYNWEPDKGGSKNRPGGTILYVLKRGGTTMKVSINFRMAHPHEIAQKYREILEKSGVAV